MRYHRIAGDNPSAPDKGLAEITGGSEDAGKFRTPGLRNVALSAPYLHDGSAQTLDDAIRRHYAPGSAPARDTLTALIAFLNALTDPRFISNPAYSLPKTACGKPL